MVALYITSLAKGAGKTTICAGLGKRLLDDGKKIGFLKPVIVEGAGPPSEGIDSDAAFMKYLFSLSEPIEVLSPTFRTESDMKDGIKEAYNKTSQGKDVVIIEGISDQSTAEALDARTIVVASYSPDLPATIESVKSYGPRLLGVVLNKVPVNRIDQTQSEISPRFTEAGVNVLGILPEDRILLALTINELTEHINGEIFRGADKASDLVENLLLGAMVVDPGPEYFSRKDNKAAVIRSERPDMQLAALETSTRCLVLTGNTELNPAVVYRAEEKDVPIVLTENDIQTVVSTIEDALDRNRFNQENKLPKLIESMKQYFDFEKVYKGLGLAG